MTEKTQSQANDDKRSMIQVVVLAVIDTPPNNNNNNNNDDDDEKEQKRPSLKRIFELLGISVTNGYRIFNSQQQQRKDIRNGVELSY